MRKLGKYIIAIVVLVILAVIGNWPGAGTKDEWDSLKKWVRRDEK